MSKLSINDKVVWTKTPKVSIPDNGQGVVIKIEENKQKLLMVTIQMGEEEKPVKKKRGRKKASSNCFDIPEKIAKSYLQKLGNDGTLEKIE